MSLIEPFSGIRPKKKFAKEVTSPNISYIDNYKPIARLFGNMYAELSDFFELKRLNYEQWMEDKDKENNK